MVAVGYASLPIVPSLRDITKTLSDQLVKPAADASRRAGEAIEKNVGSSADAAAKDVEKANFRVMKSAQELEQAESKLTEQKLKKEAADKAVEVAARKRSEAESKGADAVARAEQDLLKKRAASEREARNLATAEQGVEKAMTESARAAESLEKRQSDLEKAQDGARKSGGKLADSFGEIRGEVTKVGDSIKDATGNFGGLGDVFSDLQDSLGKGGLIAVGATATAGAITGIASVGKEVSGEINGLNRELGLTGEVADAVGDEISQVMRSGVVASAGEATEVVGAMKQQFRDMPVEEIDALADNVSAFAQTFELEVGEATQIAGQMLKLGLAGDTEEAVDLMTVAMQRVPVAMRGELGDAITEYGVNFSNLGYSGEEAFEMLANAAELGQYSIDKTGDAIKEFSVLAIDEAKAEAFESLGINADMAATKVAEGGEGAREVLEQTAQALLDMEDPGARAATAVELFGAPIEDLGVDQIPAFLEGLAGTSEGLGEVEGASQQLSDSMAGSLQGRLNAAKGWLQSLASDGFMAVWDATQWVIDGVGKLTGPVTDALGVVSGAWSDIWATITTDEVVDGDGALGRLIGTNNASAILGGIDTVKGAWSDIWRSVTTDEVVEGDGALGFLIGTNNANQILGGIDTVKGAWSEVKSAFTLDGDEGYGSLAMLVGADNAEWVVEKVSSVIPAWDEVKGAITGVDEGYGGLASLIGADNAEWVVTQIASVRDGFIDFKDRIVEGFGQVRDALAPVFEWLQDFVGGQLSETFESLKGTFSSLWDSIKSIGEALGGAFGAALEGAFSAGKSLWEALKPVVELLGNILLPILKIVGGVIGGVVVGAVMAFIGAIRFAAEVIEFFAGIIQWLSENVLSPLIGFLGEVAGFLIEHVAGAVGFLVEKFAEFGNYLIENFWPAVQTVMEWVGGAFSTVWDGLSWAYENIIKPVFDGIWQVAQFTLGVIGTAVLGPLMVAWNLLSSAIQWGWENLIKPAWDAISTFATETLWPILDSVFGFIGNAWSGLSGGIQWAWENIILVAWSALQSAATFMWQNVLLPVFDGIKAGWNALADGVKWAYENIILVAWSALQNAARFMYENVLKPVFQWIVDRWNDLSNGLRWAYDSIIKPTWDALGNALTWLYNNVVRPVMGWIGDRWTDMADILEFGWHWIRDNVFTPLGDGLETVQGWFEAAVDGIGRIWDGLRAAAASPVRFVVDTVWNNGILAAWNAIATFLPGIDEKDPVPLGELGSYARGTDSIVPGPRSVNRDNMRFISADGRYGINLAGDEGIAHQNMVAGLGGKDTWDRLNYAARTRGPAAVSQELGSFASGGTLQMNPNVDVTTDIQRAMIAAVAQAFPNQIVTSATRYADVGSGYDNHMAGRAVDFAPDQRLASWIASTYPNSAELFWDAGPNLKNGNPTGAIGGHSDHVHWAMASMVDPYTGEVVSHDGPGGGGGGILNAIANRARGIWEDMVSPLTNRISDKLGEWGDSDFTQIPGAMLTSLKDAAWDKISGWFGRGGSKVDTSGVVGSNVEIGKQLAEQVGWTGSEWDALKELWTHESNWDNNAQNPTSTAYGIPQFLDQTWATVGYQKTSDPATQIAAGIEYIQGRPDYGGLPSNALAAWWSRDPHWYDQGGWLQPGLTQVVNGTGKPEAVFTDWQWMIMRGIVDGTTDMADAIAAVLGDDSELVSSIRDFSRIVDEQSQIDWDTRLQSLEDHLAGIETNEEGEREQVRGRIGHPDEIALWAGTEIAEQFANDALGIIGLDGLVDLPRHLDDDLRVPFEQQSTPEDTAADSAAAETVSGQSPSRSVADQAAESGATGVNQASTVEVNVTFNNVDPSNVDELRSMVDELADKVARATNGRRDAVAVSRGASI